MCCNGLRAAMASAIACCTKRETKSRGKEYYSVSEPLSDRESGGEFTGEQPITTITFFSGADAAYAEGVLKERLQAVVKANPWMVGRIVRNKEHKNLQLVHPIAGADVPEDVMANLLQVDPPDVSFNSGTPYPDLVKAIMNSSASLPILDMPTFASEFESDLMVTRITIVTDTNVNMGFALIMSMSHVIADGRTYYQVLNQLSTRSTITSFTATRYMEAPAKVIEACGQAESEFISGAGVITNVLHGWAFGKRTNIYCHYVDDSKMAAAKSAAQEQCKEQGVESVSSNDILASTLAKVTKVRLLMMVLDFRGLVKEIDTKLAGNYESCIWIDEGVYSNPAAIRKFQQGPFPMITHTKPLPGTYELTTNAQMGCCFEFLCNEDLFIGTTKQQLHLPLIPPDFLPWEAACFFRPRAGTLAVMIFSKRFERETFLEAMPLGDDLFG